MLIYKYMLQRIIVRIYNRMKLSSAENKYSLVGDLKLKYMNPSETRPKHKSINEQRVTHKKMKTKRKGRSLTSSGSRCVIAAYLVLPTTSPLLLYPLPNLSAVNAAGILR